MVIHRGFLLVAIVAVILSGPAGAALATDGVGVVDTATGEWYLRDPDTGATTRFFFGDPGDVPMMGDWDCDGVDTPGLYRRSDGFVYLRNSNTQGVGDIRFFFGNPSDLPLAGDFDGDGCDTVSIYRPAESRVFVINRLGADEGGLGAADFAYVFGNPGDVPFVGDFDGNGTDDVGLHREATGLVYFRLSHSPGIADASFIYGDPGDKIVAGTWSEAAGDTVGIYRASQGSFWLNYVNAGGAADEAFKFGHRRMLPVAGAFGDLPGDGEPPYGTHLDPSWPLTVTIITDSVVLGAERYLLDAWPGWDVEVWGKPAVMLHQVEDTYLPPGAQTGALVVMAIGYNSIWQVNRENYDKYAAKFDREAEYDVELMLARGAKKIAWVTLREPAPEAIQTPQQIDQANRWGWYLPYVNERLVILDARYPEVVLADWAAVSSGPGLTYDLIHLNPAGARLMTEVIVGAF